MEILNRLNKYLYAVNYPVFEEELCLMEMRTLFGKEPENKVLISERCFIASNSPFIKSGLDIVYEKDSFEEILQELEKNKMSFDNFKVEYLRLESGNIPYEDRLKNIKEVGLRIIGLPDMRNPEIILGLTKYKEKWLFGIMDKNNYKWHEHDRKPHSYSNSMGVKLARAVVNIAADGNCETKIIDPCCGVGTTIVEGLSMNYDIVGYEINSQISLNAKENLEFYALEPKVITGDMHDIDEEYDSSIIDIPYGIFSHTSLEEQQDIINTARRISKKMIMISFENLDSMIKKSGFEIIDSCTVSKGSFKRCISVCK